MRTNWKAPTWRIVEVDLANPAPEHWREVIPESDAVLDSFNLTGGKIAAHYTQNVVSRVKIFDPEGKLLREVKPPVLGNLSGLFGRWSSSETFYAFSSFNEPPTIYRYEVATGKQSVWSQRKLPIDRNTFEVKQVWYASKDGTKIPMFLAYAKGLKLDGTNPTLLTGYGGFNLSSTPSFSALAAAWMENGGVYALANLRGGGEFGEAWHHAGMLDKKQNVFDDFIAAAEWLIANKYTSPKRLAISGGSNGGLLVGAAMTQRPELFGAAICRYPLLDMVRYQKFLVAKYWVDEYGSSDNPEQLKYILSYSPYQHVKAGTKYPAVFFITGDSDTRVAPLHARKMTALMQASTGSDKPIMIRYETKTGHSSAGLPVSLQIDNMAEELAFLMWQLGMKNSN
jgi:prolyl oligopeptidase